ncbi:Uncharacterized protein DBV15_11361 [Temnothorax longispinosus]|uniref:Uncharacterized protein n=1 Tax=Temnothorax longispinosus TaxID=300112 RepID=A0A4S2KSA3_9HYME|nr:Uncharacterized protein DBV15_11361 [Temnothorax longispinosus]
MLIPRVVPSASTSYTLESSGSRDRAPEPSTLLRYEPRIGTSLSWHHILVAILNKSSVDNPPYYKFRHVTLLRGANTPLRFTVSATPITTVYNEA